MSNPPRQDMGKNGPQKSMMKDRRQEFAHWATVHGAAFNWVMKGAEYRD
jgi:hypothetical protein